MSVQLQATSGLPQEKSPWQTLYKRLPEAQNRSEFCWLELNYFVLLEKELVNILTELTRPQNM